MSNFLVMPQCPCFISLSVKKMSFNEKSETFSFSFIARFKDGSEKILNKVEKIPLGVSKYKDGDLIPLSMDICSLYFKDWSKSPSLGKWDNDFPSSVIPEEIINLLPINSLLGRY